MSDTMPTSTARRATLGGACAVAGLSALALANTDTMLRVSFERAFGDGGQPSARLAPEPRWLAPVSASEATWLGSAPTQFTGPGQGLARAGDRMAITVEGGRKLDLDVVAVSEIAAGTIHVGTDTVAPRLVMLTCREIGETGRAGGRIIRFIVEADTAAPDLPEKATDRAL